MAQRSNPYPRQWRMFGTEFCSGVISHEDVDTPRTLLTSDDAAFVEWESNAFTFCLISPIRVNLSNEIGPFTSVLEF